MSGSARVHVLLGGGEPLLREHLHGVRGLGQDAGGQLFGFLGMLLALPVAAVGNVLLRYAHERYTHSRLYAGDKPEIELAHKPLIVTSDTKGGSGS